MTAPFVILAVVTIGGAVAAMTLRKLVHCALALAVCFVGLAGLYLDLNAQFVGLVQVLVYVGAVVILIVFAILLTRHDELPAQTNRTRVAGLGVSAVVFALLAWAVTAGGAQMGAAVAAPEAAMKDIGGALMQKYVLPLEVVGLLLTAALIGAVVIAMEEKKKAR
ncbi:MAG TPA: NADH-quinone oxidoreductase subunit J [Acidobacteriaceae bacterium]|nr:NADH-quinone oxidoreductase subunit J [Acidobacteriaceae bacterium]